MWAAFGPGLACVYYHWRDVIQRLDEAHSRVLALEALWEAAPELRMFAEDVAAAIIEADTREWRTLRNNAVEFWRLSEPARDALRDLSERVARDIQLEEDRRVLTRFAAATADDVMIATGRTSEGTPLPSVSR